MKKIQLFFLVLLFPAVMFSQVFARYNFNNPLDALGLYNGPDIGRVFTSPGIRGNCLSYTSGQSQTIPYISPLSSVAHFTMEAWIYYTAGTGSIAGYGEVAGTSWTKDIIFMYPNTATQWLFQVDNAVDGGFNVTTTAAIITNKWHQFIMVYDGTGTGNAGRLKVYMDGNMASGSYDGTYVAPATTDPMTGATCAFCQYSGASTTSGKLDEFIFYSNSLTPAQVRNEYSYYTGKFQ